jgi:hypothetical protein
MKAPVVNRRHRSPDMYCSSEGPSHWGNVSCVTVTDCCWFRTCLVSDITGGVMGPAAQSAGKSGGRQRTDAGRDQH